MKIRVTLDMEVEPVRGTADEAEVTRSVRASLIDVVLDTGFGLSGPEFFRVMSATSSVPA